MVTSVVPSEVNTSFVVTTGVGVRPEMSPTKMPLVFTAGRPTNATSFQLLMPSPFGLPPKSQNAPPVVSATVIKDGETAPALTTPTMRRIVEGGPAYEKKA